MRNYIRERNLFCISKYAMYDKYVNFRSFARSTMNKREETYRKHYTRLYTTSVGFPTD